MNDTSAQSVESLKVIGRNADLRRRWVRELQNVERVLAAPGLSVRDEITAPIIDALFSDVGILRKTLANGVIFDFHYRSKIAREFVMSDPEVSDHVWEPQTTKLLLHLARSASEVLVGGAYFGDHAILIANELRGRGRVHAFEPNPDQNAMLKHNAEINGLTNVLGWRLGLWSESSRHLRLVGDDALAHPEVDTQSADSFETISVDDYLSRQGIENLGLIMLDIEGAELGVLRGAARQLELPIGRAPNIVFELHRHYVDWSNGLGNTEVVQFLAQRGYHVFALRDYNANVDMRGQPIELVELDNVYLEGPPHGFNMVAVKDLAVLRHEGIRFCRGVSPKLLSHREPRLHQPLAQE